MQEQSPLLSLRMKAGTSGAGVMVSFRENVDSLDAMRKQEEAYSCRDYLGRRSFRQNQQQQQQQQEQQGSHVDCIQNTSSPPMADQCEELIDAVCREKMCEWSYRVCDHFRTNREIVAFAFSFLDRFIDRCSCDRTAFKLAAMTSLYMATKIFNVRQISISSLAELSRGEFEMSHISEMERIILETLEWRLNPPTVQSFITRLEALLPPNTPALATVHNRAVFLAELSVYDYSFVTKDGSVVAVACLLNALELMDDAVLSHEICCELLKNIQTSLTLSCDDEELEQVQGRLWYLYSCSAQLLEEDVIPLHISKHGIARNCPGKQFAGPTVKTGKSQSPVSVHLKGRLS